MTKGRKALEADDFCTLYHCAGDCGKRGHGVQHISSLERYRHKKMVLAAFDELEADEQRRLREARSIIERKAKDSL